uniref:Uncharacterized protein n=1 Tax=uncultured marine virus TaxID=186617 RepID=A0A0F7L6Z6_9VIRU|nr:hypothetical protein [uncultured marine virus]
MERHTTETQVRQMQLGMLSRSSNKRTTTQSPNDRARGNKPDTPYRIHLWRQHYKDTARNQTKPTWYS